MLSLTIATGMNLLYHMHSLLKELRGHFIKQKQCFEFYHTLKKEYERNLITIQILDENVYLILKISLQVEQRYSHLQKLQGLANNIEKSNNSYNKALNSYNDCFEQAYLKLKLYLKQINELVKEVDEGMKSFYYKFLLQTMSAIRSM